MGKIDIFALGTPVIDFFAYATDAQLKKLHLHKHASNFMQRKKIDRLCVSLGKNIVRVHAGDNARNVCEGISSLGCKCAYAGSVGRDIEARAFAASLRNNKIENRLQQLRGSTDKIAALLTPDKQRTFAVGLGNSEDYSRVDFATLRRSKCLFLTSITALSRKKLGKTSMQLMKIAKKRKIPLVFSLESPPMVRQRRNDLLLMLAKFPPCILFANEEEFAALDINAKEFLMLAKIVVLKQGARGATVFSEGKCIYVPAKKVKVVDTTGAGDYFAAGFLYGMCKKKSLKECGQLGARLAAKAISTIGATLD